LLFELEVALPLEPAGTLEEDVMEEDPLDEDFVEDGVVVTAGVVV